MKMLNSSTIAWSAPSQQNTSESGKVENPATPPCLVWLPADHRALGRQATPYLVLGDRYARAVQDCAGAQPVMFPLAPIDALPALLDLVDGVLLTGSSSNVHPSHFGQAIDNPSLPLDPERDALTLALVRGCVERGVPLLGICRGFQEMNVALGGSLHQTVQAVSGLLDHRETGTTPEQQYAPSHEIRLTPGSAIEHWAGGPVARVNSLHGQGVDRLAPGLRATAYAPDGLIEAFELENARSFACAVQWHPEWRCQENPFYARILGAFGAAARKRRVHRLGASRMNLSENQSNCT